MDKPSEKIKEKIDIVDFIKDYVELKPAGRNFKGRCPFHSERTPSFIVSKERQIWHCFGCGAGGDIFKFLMNFENLEFREALKILAEKAGIELRSVNPEEYRQFGVLYDINSAAKDFYVENLNKFPNIIDYLLKRGLKRETIEEFEIGYAPNEFDGTTTHLIKKGFKADDIVRSGIAFRTDSGRIGDRFRGRIMFPIHNHSGKVVGFTGRILQELENADTGKYINSPETPIYGKSKILYGFWKTKKNIREVKTALLVEGQMDFLMSYQSGVKNAVATSGTALTADHIKVLKPLAERVVVSFDNDDAGFIASEKGIDLLGANDFEVVVLELDNYKDPADAALKDSGFLAKAVLKARSAMEHYFGHYLKDSDRNRKDKIRAILGKIKKLWSPIDRARWINELSHKTNLSEKDLREEMDKMVLELSPGEKHASPISQIDLTKAEVLAERILGLLSLREDFKQTVEENLKFMPNDYAGAYKALFEDSKDVGADSRFRDIMNLIVLRSSIDYGMDKEGQDGEFSELIKELEIEYLKKHQKEMQKDIALEESNGSEKDLTEKLKRFDELSRRMQNIRNKK